MRTISLFFITILLFTGCIHETLDECPVGDVKIHVYVEKFKAVTHNYPADMEAAFNTRIKDIHYLLFKDNALQEEGRLEDLSSFSGNSYTFERMGLDFGDYCLVLVSNCAAFAGGNSPSELYLNYAGIDNREDYFAVCYPFTVDCNCETEYNVYLERTHGVIRYTFNNIPAEIIGIEMTMTNVGTRKAIDGDYSGQVEVTKLIPVGTLPRAADANSDITVVIGTFPTTAGMRSAYRLRLFKDGEETPWYNETVTDTLTVRRNQHLDIITRFSGLTPSFEVVINTSWDGSTSGGETDIE